VLDPISRDMTLRLARRFAEHHRPVAGRCEHCRLPSPCPAARRIAGIVATLAEGPARAASRAAVHPSWHAGQPTDEDEQ